MKNYEIIQIDANSWRIENGTVRWFLFTGTQRALVVDSGKTMENTREVVESLTKLPVLLVNTHTDFDHIACNGQFDEIRMSPAEYPGYAASGRPMAPVKPLWEGDVLDLGGRRFTVIETPGHTTGSLSLLDRENRILVGGDGIQDGTIYMFGAHRSLWAYCASLEKLMTKYGGQFDLVYPSHGSFPVRAELIPALKQGAEAILAGKVPGTPGAYLDSRYMAHDIGAAVILAEAAKEMEF